MATYATDANIDARDANADTLRPTGETTYLRQRTIAYGEINDRIKRRNPPIEPGDLADVTELTKAEVYYVLHLLYHEARSRAGGGDLLADTAAYWRTEFEREIADVPLTVAGEGPVSVWGGIPVDRS